MPRFPLFAAAALLAILFSPLCAGDPATDPTTQPSVIDLIQLTDHHNHNLTANEALTFRGFTLDNGTLVTAKSGPSHVEFPYLPPDEYDYRIVFTRSSGNGDMICIIHGGDRQFVWRMGGRLDTAAGFALVNGKAFGQNPTSKVGDWLLTGQQEQLLIEVRRDHVTASINDVPITTLQTDYHDITLGKAWKQSRTDTIGLYLNANDLTIESAEVTEISGPGRQIP